MIRTFVVFIMLIGMGAGEGGRGLAAQETPTPAGDGLRYRVLATNRTSTMERELNETAISGFRFHAVMGGETAGGNEVVVLMIRGDGASRYSYKLLATSRTSTMEREIQAAANEGFEYRGQTIFETAFGGEEVVCILEKDAAASSRAGEYRLLATSRTSTLERELSEAAAAGYEALGLTLGKTAMGGKELVVITRRSPTP